MQIMQFALPPQWQGELQASIIAGINHQPIQQDFPHSILQI
jgi:hypothetical protein